MIYSLNFLKGGERELLKLSGIMGLIKGDIRSLDYRLPGKSTCCILYVRAYQALSAEKPSRDRIKLHFRTNMLPEFPAHGLKANRGYFWVPVWHTGQHLMWEQPCIISFCFSG